MCETPYLIYGLLYFGIHFGHVRMCATPYPIYGLLYFGIHFGHVKMCATPYPIYGLLYFGIIHFGHVRMCATPYPISWIIFILDLGPSYTEIVGIPMGTNCAPLVADLFLYCYERDFMESFNHDNQAGVIEAFNLTSRYLDDLLNIDNPYFEGVVNQIYPPELQLNKANISDTEAPFLDLHLSFANGFVSSKIYDKRDEFDFDIVNIPFLDGDVPRRAS